MSAEFSIEFSPDRPKSSDSLSIFDRALAVDGSYQRPQVEALVARCPGCELVPTTATSKYCARHLQEMEVEWLEARSQKVAQIQSQPRELAHIA